MLLKLKRACSLRTQYLLKLPAFTPFVTVLPQIPCNFVRRPRPGVNHLPIAIEAPGLERNFLKGLLERFIPCSSLEYHAFHSPPTWMNQLLQKELVATLYFCTGSA